MTYKVSSGTLSLYSLLIRPSAISWLHTGPNEVVSVRESVHDEGMIWKFGKETEWTYSYSPT